MAMIEGGKLRLAKALCDGEDSAVNEADFEVGIGLHQLADALIVARGQILNVQLAGLDRVEQLREGICSEFPAEQVVKLDQDGRGDDATFRAGLEEGRTALVVGVVGDHRCDQGAGVED